MLLKLCNTKTRVTSNTYASMVVLFAPFSVGRIPLLPSLPASSVAILLICSVKLISYM